MPQEEMTTIVNTTFEILQILLVIAFAVIFALMFISTRPIIESKRMESAALEISENLYSSPLTREWAVFSSIALNRFTASNNEPFARYCGIAYHATIDDGDRKWEFGFEPNTRSGLQKGLLFYTPSRQLGFLNEYRTTTAVSVDGKPAIMHLEVYEDTLTLVTCLIDSAYKLKRKETIPCTMPPKNVFQLPPDVKSVTCKFALEKINSDVCISPPEFPPGNPATECRSLPGINIAKFVSDKQTERETEMRLVAIPLKIKQDESSQDCGCITDDMIAGENDEIVTIALCFEPKERPESFSIAC